MTEPESQRAQKDSKQKLISQIYEVALRPELYDSMIDLWDNEISAAVEKLQKLNDQAAQSMEFRNPDIEEHFERAYQILERMGRSSPQSTSLDQLLAKAPGPTLAVEQNGSIQGINHAARLVFGEAKSLADLSSTLEHDQFRSIKNLLLRLERPLSAFEVFVFTLPIAIHGSNEPIEQMFICRPFKTPDLEHPVMLIEAAKIAWTAGLERMLAQSFGLTASELSVVSDLCDGKNLNQIARDRDRSIHTVRTQIKSILAKTGSASQLDLVRTVSLLAPTAARGAIIVADEDKLITGERIDVPLADGRNLPVNVIGPADGRPALFLHGMLDGFAFDKKIMDALKSARLKLIAPSRPGFGDSPPAHDKYQLPAQFASDLEAVLDQIGINTCPVIGHMAGSVYAFAAAKALPKRITAVCSVAGGVPMVSLSQFRSMSNRQRVVAMTARFTPALLPTILRAGIAQIESGGDEAFLEALYKDSPIDQETASQGRVRAALLDGYRFAIAQGHRAFEFDSIHVTRNWSEYVHETKQPVILFHGSHDHVVTIKSVHDFANRYENITLNEYEDCGQLVFLQKTEDILARIAGSL